MMNTEIQNKINKLPEEITELITLLITEDDEFNNVFINGEEINTNLFEKNKNDFFSKVLKVALEIDTLKSFEEYLVRIGFSERECEILIKNTKDNFISLVKEITNDLALEKIQDTNNKKNDDTKENPLEEAKIADAGHISHVDILSEIENPTPSINTTATFQKEVSQKINVTTGPVAANIGVSTSKSNTLQNNTLSTSPSLHSSDPSVVPYSNPALHIASKLDQNLSAPSASVPKDIYVSKKPDPYHEPVEM